MPVFISHSFSDTAIYSVVCMALDKNGVQRWDPITMSAGESLADQLRKAINACEVCVFIATRRSLESAWCLAELGAFWGAAKKVLLFVADPDLTESAFPPQFKGTLRVGTAEDLIKAIVATEREQAAALAHLPQDGPYEFFESSSKYGIDEEWEKLIDETTSHFDILGIALTAWRRMRNFRDMVRRKSELGCQIRILLMHENNQLLHGLHYNTKGIESLRRDIIESVQFYSELGQTAPTVQVRQIKRGIPHFFLTRTDQHAVVIQYMNSQEWGHGPTWRCPASAKLYRGMVTEFEFLWKQGSSPSASKGGRRQSPRRRG